MSRDPGDLGGTGPRGRGRRGPDAKPLDQESDEALIRHVRQGDERAARALYNRHVDFVYRVTLRLTADRQDATEATQDAFVRAFNGLDAFSRGSSFRTWLFRVAHNAALNLVARSARKFERELSIESSESGPPLTSQPQLSVRRRHRSEQLERTSDSGVAGPTRERR